MNNLSLQPDEHMKWIYDTTHPGYDSDKAKDLRERRLASINSCPIYMIEEAYFNDNYRKINK